MVASEGPTTWLTSSNLLLTFLSDLLEGDFALPGDVLIDLTVSNFRDGDPALAGDTLIDITVELIFDFVLIISFFFCFLLNLLNAD
jgi:hypothetical protein